MKKVNAYISVILSSLLLLGCSSPKEISFKDDDIEIEYGKKINKDLISELVENPESLPNDLTIKIDDKKLSKNGRYDVGEYTLTLSGDGILDTDKKISIKDMKPPTIKQETKEVEINSNVDLKSLFKVTDLSECDYSVDSNGFNIGQAGTYNVSVTAKDQYDNESKENFEITVRDYQAEQEAQRQAQEAEAQKQANTLTDDEKTWSMTYTKIYTKEYALSPSSIDWASPLLDGEYSWLVTKVNGLISVYTSMECENAFRVKMPHDVYTQFKTSSDGKAENMVLVSLQIDGEQYYGQEQ